MDNISYTLQNHSLQSYTGLLQHCRQHDILHQTGEPLSRHCSFQLGGPADVMLWPSSEEELAGLLRYTAEQHVPRMILGRGSTMLFSDEGFRGAVICLGKQFAGVRHLGDGVLDCDSGASLTQVCRFAAEQGLTGLEFAYGIPGTLGGAVYMNAGAYGGEMKDVLDTVRHLDRKGAPGSLKGGALELSYRHSAYSGNGCVITGATLRLLPGDPAEIKAKMDDILNRRQSKQPLDYPSAGSTFKRPQGNYASALVDQCGLKGFRRGGAKVSEKHAGFVINAGNATSADVRALIAEVQRVVKEKTGYQLECEVKIID